MSKADTNKRLFHYRDIARILHYMEDSIDQSNLDSDPDAYFFAECYWLFNRWAASYPRLYGRVYSLSRFNSTLARNLPVWSRDFDVFLNRFVENEVQSAFEDLISVLAKVLFTGDFKGFIDYIVGKFSEPEE